MDADKEFYDRADEHINLSNEQISNSTIGKVSASMMFATSRFNAYVSAIGFNNSDEMKKSKEETIKYFVEQFEKMLINNLEDYIHNFDDYMEKSNPKFNNENSPPR